MLDINGIVGLAMQQQRQRLHHPIFRPRHFRGHCCQRVQCFEVVRRLHGTREAMAVYARA